MGDSIYVKKLPTVAQLQARARSTTPVKQVALPAAEYAIAIKLFDMAHGIQIDRLDEFCLAKKTELRELYRSNGA